MARRRSPAFICRNRNAAHECAYSYRDDPAVPDFPDDKPLIIFDGECGFCSRDVDLVLRHDKDRLFRFTPAQSALGTALMLHYGFETEDYETSLLIDQGIAYSYSDSVLKVFELLGGLIGLAAALRFLPRFIRDGVYRVVARNRMKIAGRRQTCRMPTPEERERFLS